MSETTETTTATTSTQPVKSPRNSNRIRVGGLWQKENEYGIYFTGIIDRLSIPKYNGERYNLAIYPTREKRASNSPDYGIFIFTENTVSNIKKETVKPVKKEVVAVTVEDETVIEEEVL